MQFFTNTIKAKYVSRPNRFTIQCNLSGKEIQAHLPNPGRLKELLIPGKTIYLEKTTSKNRKLPYTAVAVEKNKTPVALHTQRTNDVAEHLLKNGQVPGLEGAEIIKREALLSGSRFDFILEKDGQKIILEVKSCTLFSESVAMFPDAITLRGRRHIEELVRLSEKKLKGAVLFIVNSLEPDFFIPEYHTDLGFSRALLQAKNRIMILPVAVGWNKDLSLKTNTKLLKIPWSLLDREAHDQGCYLLIIRLREDRAIEIGRLGEMEFKSGYYIYAGSAKKRLSKRIERHRRIRKKHFWHIDYLRDVAELQAAMPIRTKDDLECELTDSLKKITDREVPGFGSSDCRCPSHLFAMTKNPIENPDFHRILQYYRIERFFK